MGKCYAKFVSRSLKAHILLVLTTFVWGATFVMIKNALTQASPFFFNAIRMTVAAIALLLVFWKDLRGLSREAAKLGILVGAFLWLGYEFQTTGLRLTTPSKSAFVTGFSVILVPVFLAIGFRRLPNRWTLGGVAAAFAGLYFMTIPAGNGSGFNLQSINRGDLLTLGCALSFALQIITIGRAMQRFRFEQIAVLEAIACAVLMWPSVALETVYVTWSAQVITAILVTSLLCTAAAFTIQAWAQQFTPPTHTALIFVLEPVFAWLTSYVLLGEQLGMRATVGAFLILGGILLSELKGGSNEPKRELEPQPSLTEVS